MNKNVFYKTKPKGGDEPENETDRMRNKTGAARLKTKLSRTTETETDQRKLSKRNTDTVQNCTECTNKRCKNKKIIVK